MLEATFKLKLPLSQLCHFILNFNKLCIVSVLMFWTSDIVHYGEMWMNAECSFLVFFYYGQWGYRLNGYVFDYFIVLLIHYGLNGFLS